MPISKASSSAVAPGAKGDLVVGTTTNDSGVLAVGSANQVLTVDSSTATGLKWATPASTTTWTGRYGLDGVSFNNFHYANNLYVAVGIAGTLLTSSDAITWTSRTSGFGANFISDVTYVTNLSLWIIVGDNGTLATSSDAITWTLRTSNMGSNQINVIAFDGSTVVAVGRGGGTTNTGGITYSTDGITWTRKNQSLSVGEIYNTVIYNGTNWLVGADFSTNNYLYASTPSGTWTAANSGSSTTLSFIGWDGTRTWAIDLSILRYSTSTTFSSPTNTNSLGTFTANENANKIYHLFNGKLYLGGANGFMANYGTTVSNTNFLLNQTKEIVPGSARASSVSSQAIFSTGRIVFSESVIFTSF